MANPMIEQIRADLLAQADPAALESGRRFFKEEVRSYGVTVPLVNGIAKGYVRQAKADGLDKAEIWALCDELWASGYLEETFVACLFSESQHQRYEASDFEVFQRWVRQDVTNWASCDTLCNHTVGDLLMAFPELAERLMEWTGSPNRWVRRAGAVSLIVPARKGLFHSLAFRIADALLSDGEDLVQKGYGWLLKAVSEADQASVFAFVMERRDRLPRTALRYAIEKMPPELKQRAMARP